MKLTFRIAVAAAFSGVLLTTPSSYSSSADALELANYHAELTAFRAECGGTVELPDVPFFLFGMGQRTKLIYKSGTLIEAATGKVLRQWPVKTDLIIPSTYTVAITTTAGDMVRISEDAQAVWIEEHGGRQALVGTQHQLHLPAFGTHRYARILRVLHQELLINVIGGQPVPNFFVYPKPWYRDGAMMALCFKTTGNLDEIKDWVLGLTDPYDRNNKGETEADNLGQALFLLSLVSDKHHPLVAKVLAELPCFEVTTLEGKFLRGRSDFAAHPAYQTKWAKFGLRALGLPDAYTVPRVPDSYAALFWMDFKDTYVKSPDAGSPSYPYLNWACDHFHGTKRSPIGNRDYPLTWERNASAANYAGMKVLAEEYTRQRLAVPHTWHAAEMFLFVFEQNPK